MTGPAVIVPIAIPAAAAALAAATGDVSLDVSLVVFSSCWLINVLSNNEVCRNWVTAACGVPAHVLAVARFSLHRISFDAPRFVALGRRRQGCIAIFFL
jgi:hypothetical protein